MLVWSKDNLEEFCEGQCDLPPLFSFVALSLDNNLMQNDFSVKPLPWYYIDYFEWGDVLLLVIPYEKHQSGLWMITFSPSLSSIVFNNWTICIRFILPEMKVNVYVSGWWIQCDEDPVEALNALRNIWATYVMRSNCKPKGDVFFVML
jgi:hypothetical protein